MDVDLEYFFQKKKITLVRNSIFYLLTHLGGAIISFWALKEPAHMWAFAFPSFFCTIFLGRKHLYIKIFNIGKTNMNEIL